MLLIAILEKVIFKSSVDRREGSWRWKNPSVGSSCRFSDALNSLDRLKAGILLPIIFRVCKRVGKNNNCIGLGFVKWSDAHIVITHLLHRNCRGLSGLILVFYLKYPLQCLWNGHSLSTATVFTYTALSFLILTRENTLPGPTARLRFVWSIACMILNLEI